MWINYLKRTRVIISLVLFLAITFYFIDGYRILPNSLLSWLAKFQFVPALLSALRGSLGALLIVISILLATVFFGRVYCSSFCPLGVFQDGVIRLKKWIKKKSRFKYKKAQPFIHYGVTALVFLLLILGISGAVILFDPYSNYGRIAAGIIRPVYLGGLRVLSKGLHQAGIFGLNPVNYSILVQSTLYSVVVLLIISALSWWRGRFFCNYLCPVGGVLSLVSRFSIFKLKIDHATCVSCGKCIYECKAECINVKERTIDASRCISCYNCVSACESNSIRYSGRLKSTEKNQLQENLPEDRRRLFSGVIGLGLGLVAQNTLAQERNRERHGQGQHGRGKGHYQNKGIVTPPGSYSLQHFNANCTACHLCVAKCPSNVIQPTVAEYGWTNMLQPKMEYSASYCNFNCTVCGEVCPTGAILPLTQEAKHTSQLGKVHFSRRNCVVITEGNSCGSCSEHCPTQAVHMVPHGDNLTIPEVNADICIGCGACEYACPVTVPHKAIFVVANEVHQVADKPEVKEINYDATEDFPF